MTEGIRTMMRNLSEQAYVFGCVMLKSLSSGTAHSFASVLGYHLQTMSGSEISLGRSGILDRRPAFTRRPRRVGKIREISISNRSSKRLVFGLLPIFLTESFTARLFSRSRLPRLSRPVRCIDSAFFSRHPQYEHLDQYHMGFTMRFPRALSIRDDLSIADCMTASGIIIRIPCCV